MNYGPVGRLRASRDGSGPAGRTRTPEPEPRKTSQWVRGTNQGSADRNPAGATEFRNSHAQNSRESSPSQIGPRPLQAHLTSRLSNVLRTNPEKYQFSQDCTYSLRFKLATFQQKAGSPITHRRHVISPIQIKASHLYDKIHRKSACLNHTQCRNVLISYTSVINVESTYRGGLRFIAFQCSTAGCPHSTVHARIALHQYLTI